MDSPSRRTLETAFIVNSYVGAEVDYADERMERDYGLWSGMLPDEIVESYPQEWNVRNLNPH